MSALSALSRSSGETFCVCAEAELPPTPKPNADAPVTPPAPAPPPPAPCCPMIPKPAPRPPAPTPLPTPPMPDETCTGPPIGPSPRLDELAAKPALSLAEVVMFSALMRLERLAASGTVDDTLRPNSESEPPPTPLGPARPNSESTPDEVLRPKSDSDVLRPKSASEPPASNPKLGVAGALKRPLRSPRPSDEEIPVE